MNQEQRQQIKKIIDILLRRKNLVACCVLAAMVGGLALYVRTPKTYQATALIMYQQQKINPSRMAPDVHVRIREMVSTVSQQITSRTSLEELIKKFNLYPELRQRLPMEDVVAEMRDKHITIKPESKGDIFEVSYDGGAPRQVMLVTNALASKFIEENLRFREEQVTETSAYISDELKMARAGLDKKEAAMRDYKLQYYNEMPDQRDSNMARLNALQDQYQNNEANAQSLEQTRIMIQEQIGMREKILAQEEARRNEQTDSLTPGTPVPEDDLASVRRALAALQAKYTDQHPDVKRLRKILKKLEESENQGTVVQDGTEAITGQSAGGSRVVDRQLERLYQQLKEADLNIARLRKERKEIHAQMEQYKKWVEAAPVREAEWSALTRDYDQLSRHYEELVGRNLEAKSAQTLERRQQGSQFKIVDSAHFPERPFKPNFEKIMLIAIALGLGAGVGMSFLLAALDTSFRDAAELESYLNLPVVASIPLIPTDKEKNRARLKAIIWNLALVLAAMVIFSGMIYLWMKGVIII